MIESFISDTFIRELRGEFPNRLPSHQEYFSAKPPTPEQIAFNAGIQHCIEHIAKCAEIQRLAKDNEVVSIQIY